MSTPTNQNGFFQVSSNPRKIRKGRKDEAFSAAFKPHIVSLSAFSFLHIPILGLSHLLVCHVIPKI